jgi:hypothetical protein
MWDLYVKQKGLRVRLAIMQFLCIEIGDGGFKAI